MTTSSPADVSSRLTALGTATRMQFPGLANTRADDEHLEAAIGWLDRSCVAVDEAGSAATYNLLLGWEGAYPETSGYIIPTLYRYAARTDNDHFADRATAIADWLLDIQHQRGSFPTGTGTDGDPNVFNTGQIVFGLVEAYNQTGAERFKTATERACDWLVEVQDPVGSWSQFDYKSTTHVYTTRVAWALLTAATLLPEKQARYQEAARTNLEWALSSRHENGWFENAGFEPGETPFLHTLAYTIRGLIEGGRLLDDDDIYEAGKRSADVLLDIQDEQGILKGAYTDDWSPSWFYCLPGNAQMAVIWLRLYDIEGEPKYLLAARNTAEFLKRHQPMTGPDAVRGGLPGSYPYFGKYIYLRYPNWGAKFLADVFLELQSVRDESEPQASEDNASDTCRVCLLVDGEHVQRWAAEAIEQMVSETNAEISLVVINEDAGLLGRDNIKRGKKYPAYAAFWLLSDLSARLEDTARFDDPVHISTLPGVSDARWIRTYPANVDGLWCELPEEVTAEVAAQTDLVVRRGFGLVTGDILTATEYGTLSYHHGDPRAYRGGPAGFWEFMHDTPRVGMMVQTLRDTLDAGVVQAYDEVDVSDCTSWGEIQDRIYPNSTHLLAEAVERVQDPEAEPMLIEDHGPVYHPPSAADIGRFVLKSAASRSRSVPGVGGVL